MGARRLYRDGRKSEGIVATTAAAVTVVGGPAKGARTRRGPVTMTDDGDPSSRRSLAPLRDMRYCSDDALDLPEAPLTIPREPSLILCRQTTQDTCNCYRPMSAETNTAASTLTKPDLIQVSIASVTAAILYTKQINTQHSISTFTPLH